MKEHVRFQWLEGIFERAFVQRRGGLVRELLIVSPTRPCGAHPLEVGPSVPTFRRAFCSGSVTASPGKAMASCIPSRSAWSCSGPRGWLLSPPRKPAEEGVGQDRRVAGAPTQQYGGSAPCGGRPQ